MAKKMRARVSFIVDLDGINRYRRQQELPELDEKELFAMISSKDAVITMHGDKHMLQLIQPLSYIVIS